MGDWFVEADGDCLDFNQMNLLKIEIEKKEPMRVHDALVVNDGVSDYFIMMVLVISHWDLS